MTKREKIRYSIIVRIVTAVPPYGKGGAVKNETEEKNELFRLQIFS